MESREARIPGSEAGRARVTAALPRATRASSESSHQAAEWLVCTAVAAPPSAAPGSAGEYAGGQGPGRSGGDLGPARPGTLPVTATPTDLSLCLTLVLFSH